VFFNPPFHPASGQVSPSPARDRARRDSEDTLQTWTRRAAELVRDSGSVSLVLRADRFDSWREAVRGEIQALPLLPRRGEAAKRVIALLYPGRAPALIRREPVILHEDDGRPTEAAIAVLRHGAALA
jgi:tRNA1(Val) A37 N6-methylase TrmN6